MSAHVQGDTPEAVAFGLMQCVLAATGRGNHDHPFPAGSTLLRGQPACAEQEILELFARCLRVVRSGEREPSALHAGNAASPELTHLHS